MGSLTVIFGPMFSGKTTRLLQELTRFMDVTNEEHKTKCLLINHVFDDRNEKIGISSHGSGFSGVSSLIDIQKADDLSSLDVSEYHVIGIDECQFFKDLSCVNTWVENNKIVIISGLISDAFMRPFGKIGELFHSADNVIQCHAICSECIKNKNTVITPDSILGMKAAFTFRIDSSVNQVEIGASDKYVPVCRYHYNILKKN